MPDIIIARCDEPLEDSINKKIALFCNVEEDCVIENLTLPVLYEAPIMLDKNHLAQIVCRKLKIEYSECDLTEWMEMLDRIQACLLYTSNALLSLQHRGQEGAGLAVLKNNGIL